MNLEQSLIIKNKEIAKDTYEMVCRSKLVKELQAGQFINIKLEGNYLRRPISIASIDEESYTIIYKIVGEGTSKLSKMKDGETLDILGPLGSGFPITSTTDILIIGGGVGVPPLYEVAKQYRAIGNKVSVILGFQNKESVFYEQEFKNLGCEVYICCDDGSYGYHGNVIEQSELLDIEHTTVYSCGPMGMLKAVSSMFQQGYLSFEARMACGMGACMACVVKDKEKTNLSKRICKEGPVFKIGEVEL